MFYWTPQLSNYFKVSFIQFQDFLVAKKVSPEAVWVGPADELTPSYISPSRISVAYSQDVFGKTEPLAVVYIFMNDRRVEVCSSLSNALGLLGTLFDTPANLQKVTAVDPGIPVPEAVRVLGLHFADFLTPKVGQYMPGEHLAKIGSMWRYYLVEDYGEVVPIADCELAAPLVAWAWADQESERTDLSSRLAKFIPSNSAQLIAG